MTADYHVAPSSSARRLTPARRGPHCAPTPKTSSGGQMTYDLKPMKAPRAAGPLLRVLCAAVENPVTVAALANKLLGDAGILAMRQAKTHDPLQLVPPGVSNHALPAMQPEQPPVDVHALAATPPARTEGFRFETISDFTAAYREGRRTPELVAQRVISATRAGEDRSPRMRTFIAQDAEDILRQARASTERWRVGKPLGPLDGVPVAIKDELDMKPYPTTVGTAFLGRTPAQDDATPVARLRAMGAVLIGKTNMHEMGLGVTGLNPVHGAARNPYDPGRATGGSSSGTAAAVAAGLCPLAIGADGGGSIRIPSGLCGVVGLKATFGRVSEHGAAELCWSVAHVGPIAASVTDCALGYVAVAGPDPRDPGTQRQPAVHLADWDNLDLHGLRVGVYPPWFKDAEPDVVKACQRGLDILKDAGASIVEVEIPELGLLQSVHLVTILSEMAAAHLHHYENHREAYGLDTRVNLALARQLTGYDYTHAQRLRVRLNGHFSSVFGRVDVLCTPTTGRTAPPLLADALQTGESNLPVTGQILRFALPANLTGAPALSVPVGYDAMGLPVGLQLMGRAWEEHLLLRVGRVVERRVEAKPPQAHHRLLA
ncbi:MAG: amidase [Myxococcota bacterium]